MRGGAPPCHGRDRPRLPVTANGQGLTEWWVQVKRTGWCEFQPAFLKGRELVALGLFLFSFPPQPTGVSGYIEKLLARSVGSALGREADEEPH